MVPHARRCRRPLGVPSGSIVTCKKSNGCRWYCKGGGLDPTSLSFRTNILPKQWQCNWLPHLLLRLQRLSQFFDPFLAWLGTAFCQGMASWAIRTLAFRLKRWLNSEHGVSTHAKHSYPRHADWNIGDLWCICENQSGTVSELSWSCKPYVYIRRFTFGVLFAQYLIAYGSTVHFKSKTKMIVVQAAPI